MAEQTDATGNNPTSTTGMSTTRVRIWDAPVRLVHWLMVLAMIVSWRTAESGAMDYHRYSGYTLLGLLIFRIFWGFFGSSTARFSDFVRGPRAIFAYLRGSPGRVERREPAPPGHNPLGALSVIALLGLILTQVILGLFTVDVDGIESGPLSTFVSFETGRACAKWHHRIFDILVWFVALHVAAVLFYELIKRQRLIATMIHGRREYPANSAPQVRSASHLWLVAGAALSGLIVWMVANAFQF
jgi:cytochrome b